MRILATIMIIFALILKAKSQSTNFDDGTHFDPLGPVFHNQVFIDTISNPDNIWEVGIPNKNKFSSSYSDPNSICTGLTQSYPINDTSSFILRHIAETGYTYLGSCQLSGKYQINTDSLNDYGFIEYSPDNGKTWIDLMEDTVYLNKGCYEWIEKPVLSGSSSNWNSFQLIAGGVSEFDIDYGDIILFRFTFISDSSLDNKDGWIIDDLNIEDFGDSSIEYRFINYFTSQVHPNPSFDFITLKYENQQETEVQIMIADNLGRLIYEDTDYSGEVMIDLKNYSRGVYYYKIIRSKKSEISIGKIMKY